MAIAGVILMGTVLGSQTAGSADAAAPKPVRQGPVVIDEPVPLGFRSWQELAVTQERLEQAARRIETAADAADGTGLGSIVLDLPQHRLDVYWKGSVPAAVQNVISGQDAAEVTIAVKAAAYSREELRAEAARITSQPASSLAAGQAFITAVGPLGDSSGLKIGVSGSLAAAGDLAAIRDTRVALTIVPENAGLPGYSRDNDSPRYWGGGQWSNGSGNGPCTTGFALSGPHGTSAMLTAEHCARDWDDAFDGGGDYMGQIPPGDPVTDVRVIETGSAGRVFTGGPTSGSSLTVVGASSNHEGAIACANGALSGTSCGAITGVGEWKLQGAGLYNPQRWISDQVHLVKSGNQPLAGNGDSGNGVYTPTSATSGNVWAKGIFTSYSSVTVPCGGVPSSSTRKCSSEIWYTDIGAALRNWPNLRIAS